jgi:hypothetical protein
MSHFQRYTPTNEAVAYIAVSKILSYEPVVAVGEYISKTKYFIVTYAYIQVNK